MVAGRIRIVSNDSGDLSRDFWIGKPLTIESELGLRKQAHAFWSCATKVVTCLLFQADRPDGHGARPHSLKVTTISTLMTEVIKGNANLSQLPIQGNYRDVTARDMAKVYSRNLAHRQISASRLPLGDFRGNRNVASIAKGPPGISEERLAGGNHRKPIPSGGNQPIGRSPF